MERKFITPVAMHVSNQQFELDIKKPLEGMGYKISSDSLREEYATCTGWGDINNAIGTTAGPEFNGRYFIDRYNPELFLALAAMSAGEEFWIGEYVCFKGKNEVLGKVDGNSGDWCRVINSDGSFQQIRNIAIRKATKEEIIGHFEKKAIPEAPKGRVIKEGGNGEDPRKGGWNETHDGVELDPDDLKSWENAKFEYATIRITNTPELPLDFVTRIVDFIHKEFNQLALVTQVFSGVNADGRIEEFVEDGLDLPKREHSIDGKQIYCAIPSKESEIRKADEVAKSFFDQVANGVKGEAGKPLTDEFEQNHAKCIERLKSIISELKSAGLWDKKSNTDSVKQPPLGIMPRKLWEEKRIKRLMLAILRYLDQDKLLQDEWVEELNYLLKKRSEDLPF